MKKGFLLGTFHDRIPAGKYPNFTIHQSGKGYMEIEFQGERVMLLTLPYPSEKRLNEIFTEEIEEEVQQKAYSKRIGELLQELSTHYREDTINLCVSHLYLGGGQESESERPIQLGGSLAVHIDEFPQDAQYIALGHLHRPQVIKEVKLTHIMQVLLFNIARVKLLMESLFILQIFLLVKSRSEESFYIIINLLKFGNVRV